MRAVRVLRGRDRAGVRGTVTVGIGVGVKVKVRVRLRVRVRVRVRVRIRVRVRVRIRVGVTNPHPTPQLVRACEDELERRVELDPLGGHVARALAR